MMGERRFFSRFILAAVLMAALLSGVAACDEDAPEPAATPEPAPPSAAVPPAPVEPATPQTPGAPVGAPGQMPPDLPDTPPDPAADPAPPGEPPPEEPGAAPGTPDRKDGDNRTLPVDLVRFVPEGSCTRKKCPPEKPCCNTCRFRRWTPQTGPHLTLKGSTAATRNIPRCKMNGCQRCAFHLLANGVKSGKRFMAFDIRKVKPASAKKHVPAP